MVSALVGVDWLGTSLAGVAALRGFSERHPQIPLTHFVSAAYLARGGDVDHIVDAMRPAFKASDELALRVAPWSSVHGSATVSRPAAQAKVTEPTPVRYHGLEDGIDAGGSDWLTAYPVLDIRAFAQNGRRVLHPLAEALRAAPGLPQNRLLTGVRAAGWAGGDAFVEAVTPLGFAYDASGANAQHLTDATKDPTLLSSTATKATTALLKPLAELWGSDPVTKPPYLSNAALVRATAGRGTDWDTRPFWLEKRPRPLLELPQLGMAPPFVSEKALRSAFQLAVQAPASETFVLSFGITQETAVADLEELQDLILWLGSVPGIRFLTHADAAAQIVVPPSQRANVTVQVERR